MISSLALNGETQGEYSNSDLINEFQRLLGPHNEIILFSFHGFCQTLLDNILQQKHYEFYLPKFMAELSRSNAKSQFQ